jgi:hypothetical protein
MARLLRARLWCIIASAIVGSFACSLAGYQGATHPGHDSNDYAPHHLPCSAQVQMLQWWLWDRCLQFEHAP